VAESIVRELEGLRALARALVHGDSDDLIQDTAVAALEHPPELDRPVRPWLAAVLRNRRKMDRRSEVRRQTRELAAVIDDDVDTAPDAIDRARALERLSAALVELDEPFRTAVVRRYLDGETAATIARALEVPAGTVRWRIKTGLDRLRTALDDNAPRWRRALVPFVPLAKGAAAVKVKTQIILLIVLLLCAGGGGLWFALHGNAKPPAQQPPTALAIPKPHTAQPTTAIAHTEPPPGQGRALATDDTAPGGLLGGRVINWSTGEGVVGAELTFASDAGALTVRSGDGGAFELAPPAPTELTLATISAPGFLPYAPEYEHSTIHVTLAKQRAVRGRTVFLFLALDYQGVVVDPAGAPVAGAKVKLLGTPAGEQQLDKLATEWTSAKDGSFTFHAADDAVFEATRGGQRGWARLDGSVAVTHKLVIKIADAAAHDATITGSVVDEDGKPVGDVLVRALPVAGDPSADPKTLTRATAFATSAPDGSFTLEHLDRDTYELLGEADGHAGARQRAQGGDRNVTLTLPVGVAITGTVVTTHGDAVPAFTLTVYRRQGARRGFEVARSYVSASGQFEIHVAPGDIEISAAATGWAPSPALRVDAKAGTPPIKLTVSAGATLTGKVVDSITSQPIAYARVMNEAMTGGGASASPSNVGTVTRSDGTFELTGLPSGPVAVTIAAGDYHPKIEGGMTATDEATLGPITIAITKLAPGEEPTLELVGIGVQLTAVDDGLQVVRVIPGGGAAAAGIIAGDLVTAVDGASAIDLGVNGAVSKIRGAAGTTVTLTLKRGTELVPVVCQRKPLKA
jgi:RNA polymerase sigma factor (sigma-70 family)